MPEYATIQDILKACTVRVEGHLDAQTEGTRAGTGFYVAPGTVLTCAHVVNEAQLGGRTALTVVEFGDVRRHEVEVIKRWDDEPTDLAILRLRTPAEHPCVLLDGQFRDYDRILGFGYTGKYPGGTPVTLEVEGQLGPPERWLQLKDGLVQPGLSGGAAVNERTGAVCGVIKRSRNPKDDHGGYAIPLSTLFRVEPKLETANAMFHLKDARWEDLLPAASRRMRRATLGTRGPEGGPESRLVVSVGQTASGWEVTADVEPGAETIGPVPIDLNIVRSKVARLFRDWASKGRMQQPDQEIALLGEILFRAVFPGAIGERFASLREGEGRLAVALRFDAGTDDDLIQLPWEHIYFDDTAEGRGVCLARADRATFSRTLERAPVASEPPARGTLRVTVVAVRPQWEGESEKALAQLDGILESLDRLGSGLLNVSLERMDEDAPDAFAIGNAIADADVVHYVGFGRFKNGVDELALGGDSEFGIEYVAPDELASAFQAASPRLVVLQLLTGQPNEVPADFSVLAPRLMEQAPDLPAVVASQYPLQASMANRFNQTLYEQLARGAAVDVAVQEARSKLRGRLSISAALFLRNPGDLRLVEPGHDVSGARSAGAFAAYG